MKKNIFASIAKDYGPEFAYFISAALFLSNANLQEQNFQIAGSFRTCIISDASNGGITFGYPSIITSDRGS